MLLKKKSDWLKKYHRFTNYTSAAMLYLKENFLLEEELEQDHIKSRILGHWGTVPGLNLIYGGLNILIKEKKQNTILVTGPGHGAPAILSGLWLEGSLKEFYPNADYTYSGVGEIIKKFSWPGGFPSHTYPGFPGSIHEGGELGYSLGTAYGTVLDNPDLLTACVVGDGEAETATISASWQAIKMLNPKTDGAVLPILHLNGYRISGPTFFGTMSNEEIRDYFFGQSFEAVIVDQYECEDVYKEFLEKLFICYQKIEDLKEMWDFGEKPLWPVLVLRTMKGWTGPKFLNQKKVEDNNISHGIPLQKPKSDEKEFEILNEWLQSYEIGEFINDIDSANVFIDESLLEYIPDGDLRLGKNKYSFGAKMKKELILPELSTLGIKDFKRNGQNESRMEFFGKYLKEIFKLNKKNKNFRFFSPDESESNLLSETYKAASRAYIWPIRAQDEHYSEKGRIMEMLSENVLQALMTGYNLTGRHGVLASYEAFLGIVTNQVEQYLKFLRQAKQFEWRGSLPSLNLVSTSTAWRQEHNGFSHQNPTLINALLTKHTDLVNLYFPADVNTILATTEKCFKSEDRVNLITACKRKTPQWLTIEEARKHVEDGVSVWHWVSELHEDEIPDVVLASAGDYQTNETIQAVKILRDLVPSIKVRYVNVNQITPLGIGNGRNILDTETELERYFTMDRGVVLNFHGYPEAIKQLTWGHEISMRMEILGYIERGTTTTPFDMQVQNRASRYHVCIEAIRFASKFNNEIKNKKEQLIEYFEMKLEKHAQYIKTHGEDMV